MKLQNNIYTSNSVFAGNREIPMSFLREYINYMHYLIFQEILVPITNTPYLIERTQILYNKKKLGNICYDKVFFIFFFEKISLYSIKHVHIFIFRLKII